MTDGSGPTAWTYDQSGNVVTVAKTIGTVTRTFTYGYNLDNSVATITYPSGLVLTYTPSPAGRVTQVSDAAGTKYADAVTYWPAGALHTAKLGKTTQFNGIDLLDSYNRRLQPTLLSAASPSQTLLSLTYDFNWGTVQAPINNGTLKSITNNLDANWSRAFTYDALNRVQTAQTPSSANYGVTFTVDPWGNLTNRDPITGKNVVWPLADPATKKNQLSSRTHDLAGNVTNDGIGHIYTYDAENRVYATGGVTYTYDGDGERVKKSSGMLYWTGTGTAALLETALDGTPTAECVFFNGKRIARIDRPSNATHYYLSDHLGSTAKVTSATGQPEEWNELGVYGEPIAGGTTRYLFTGKERDAGGEDFFGARYYAFRMGRFLTPDWANIPAPIPYSTIGEPQSLNLYTYALNNPVTGTDPDGHFMARDTKKEKEIAEFLATVENFMSDWRSNGSSALPVVGQDTGSKSSEAKELTPEDEGYKDKSDRVVNDDKLLLELAKMFADPPSNGGNGSYEAAAWISERVAGNAYLTPWGAEAKPHYQSTDFVPNFAFASVHTHSNSRDPSPSRSGAHNDHKTVKDSRMDAYVLSANRITVIRYLPGGKTSTQVVLNKKDWWKH